MKRAAGFAIGTRRGRCLTALAAPFAVIATCVGGAGAAASSELSGGDSVRTLYHGGLERSYLLHVPPGHDRMRPAAVVLVFHGGGGNAEHAARVTGFSAQADRAGFLAVYPDGTGRLRKIGLTWNGGNCCGYARDRGVDDVGFVRAVIKDLHDVAVIDARRIYAAGLSNGAILSYRLACEASDVIAAVAAVAGTQNVARCEPREPVSVIHFHGTADAHLPYEGGVGSKSRTGVSYASVMDSIRFWVQHNGCSGAAAIEQFADIRRFAYEPCAAGTAVQLYTVLGGGHAWPGGQGPAWRDGDRPTTSIAATRIIWEFFAAHPKR